MPQAIKIVPLSALKDNYIWLIIHSDFNECVVVDPGEASPVLNYLNSYRINLSTILITHKHADHVKGVRELTEHFPNARVYGPSLEAIVPTVSNSHKGRKLSLFNNSYECMVLEVPGHTLEHVAYYIPNLDGSSVIFTGDVLFSGGCGRLFEGTFQQLYTSLLKLRALPKKTQLYCGHEYTVSNLEFACWLEPNNQTIQSALDKAKADIFDQKPTLPSTLENECLINPFLRCDQFSFISNMQKKFKLSHTINPLTLFSYLREQKNHWRV